MKFTLITYLCVLVFLIAGCSNNPATHHDWDTVSTDADGGSLIAQLPDVIPGSDTGSMSVKSFQQIYEFMPEALMMVDVRYQHVFSKGTFKNAVNIPIDELIKREHELVTDKTVVFFCGAGGLAGEAHDVMQVLRPELRTYYLNAEITFNNDGGYHLVEL